MQIHPAAEVFPAMSDDQYAELKDDIQRHGLRDSVEVYQGKILDGRHRFKACKELKIVPDIITLDDHAIGGDPFAFVVSRNLHRRHLSTSQRGMVAVNIKRAMEGQSAERMKAGTKPDPMANLPQGSSRDNAGKAVGVSGRTVATAEKVTDKGAAPVVKAVKEGKLSVAKAAKIVDAAPKKSDQAKLLKKSLEDSSFDPASFADEPAKKPKPGKPTVSVKQRKDCLALLGKLCRALNVVGVYEEFITPLSQIQERLEQI